jgi:hypothetical protein
MSLVRSAVVASNATADRFRRMTVLAGFLGWNDPDFTAENHWKRFLHRGPRRESTSIPASESAAYPSRSPHEVDNGGWRSALLHRSQPDADAL